MLTVIALSIERYIAIGAAFGKGSLAKFVANIKAALAAGDMKKAQELCDNQRGSVANVVMVDPEGKVFMSLDKQSDLREVLEAMGQEYGVTFTPEETKKFSLASTFGVPMKSMKKYLDLPQDQQDAVLKNEGIPTDSIDNQFKAWVRNARATNKDLRIAIKADANTPYSVIKNVMNSLQDLRENRYNLITSLKTTSED